LTQDKFSEFYCKKIDFAQYLLKKIKDDDHFKIHKDCIKELIPLAKSQLGEMKNAKKVISFFRESNLLTGDERSYFDFMLTLTNDDIENLNTQIALDNLEKLKGNESLRSSILNQIKREILIPDQVFSPSKQKTKSRTDALKRKIARSFPEFLSYYSRQCLDYLKGTKDFPYGSPTINCHNFFKEAKRLSLIDTFTISAYKDITKL
jgi:hypothetical protein